MLAATADDCYLRPVASPPDTGPRHVGRVVDELGREDGDSDDFSTDELSSSPPPETELDRVAPSSTGPSAESEGEDETVATETVATETVATETVAAETVAADSAESPQTEPTDDTETRTASESPTPESVGSESHPVRERLLAKAAAARRTGSPGIANTGTAAVSSPASELDAIGRSAAPRPKDIELDLSTRPGTRPPSAPRLGRGRRQLSPTMLAVFGTLLGLATIASLVALMLAIDPRQRPLAVTATSSAPEPIPPSALSAPARPEIKKRVRHKLPGPWRIADAKGDPNLRVVEGKIGLLPFLRAVQEAGIKTEQAYRLVTALKEHRNLDKCAKTDRFLGLVERSTQRVKAFEYSTNEEDVYQVREGSDGLLVGRKLDLKIARAQVQGAFVYDGSSFDASAERGGFDPGLSKVMSKALDGHSGLDELARGDRVRVIAQEVTVLGDFVRYAGVEAVEIVPADSSQKPLRLYYFQGPESRGYFDDKGKQPYEGGWRKPIKDAQMTSPFNPKRLHPILKKVMPHNGMDFGAGVGTPVGASSFGTVSYIGYAGASGNLVKVEHPGGVETGYAHLSRFAEGLKLGDKVKRLQLVGYVGFDRTFDRPASALQRREGRPVLRSADAESRWNADACRSRTRAFCTGEAELRLPTRRSRAARASAGGTAARSRGFRQFRPRCGRTRGSGARSPPGLGTCPSSTQRCAYSRASHPTRGGPRVGSRESDLPDRRRAAQDAGHERRRGSRTVAVRPQENPQLTTPKRRWDEHDDAGARQHLTRRAFCANAPTRTGQSARARED